MMKKLLILLFALTPLLGFSQVDFRLQEDGSFKTADGNDYQIIKRDSMSSKELYGLIMTNLNRVYISPKDVISQADDKSISVRGYKEDLLSVSGFWEYAGVYGGHYKLLFEFKDGKIKVSAPIIEDELALFQHQTSFRNQLKKYFGNKGNISEKNKKKLDKINLYINNLINSICEQKASNNDW